MCISTYKDILLLDIQKHAGAWNDGTIIGCSPIVTGACQEPSRIVIRDLGNTLVVHIQVWPVSEAKTRVITPFYVQGDYYPKHEAGALSRAWNKFYDRFCLLEGRKNRVKNLGRKQSDKAFIRTEATTLGQL